MIVVCGEALLDVFLTPGDTPGAPPRMTAVAGGSPFNVAVGLARMGVATAFLGGVSTDPAGQFLAERLALQGVSTGCLVRRPEPTTLSLVSTGNDGGPVYTFHGAGAADISLGAADLPALPAAATCLHVGSYTMVRGKTSTTLLDLVRRQDRRVISYDVNVRLGVEPSVTVWRTRLAEMLPLTTILKLSEEDAAPLWPGRDAREVAEELAAAGPALVVLTRGAAGALLLSGRLRLEVPAAAVAVVDTVGAGDAFTAQLLAALAETGKLERRAIAALSESELLLTGGRAVAAAGLACGRRGADPPDRKAMQAAGWA
jgi:fructokinase